MKKEIQLFAFLTILLVNLSQAQEKATVDGQFNIFLSLPAHNDLGQKFDFGAGATLGAAIFLPEIKSYITPQIGFDFMPRGVGNDDTYRETIFFTNFGVEVMYQLASSDNYMLLPFARICTRKVIDRYLIANGDIMINSNGGSELDYDKQPPIFSTSAIALNFGLENRFKNAWFIRLSYELYQPKIIVDLTNSYDDIDSEIFDPLAQKLNLSTIKIGGGAYF